MRGEQFLRKAISECKEYHLPESVTKPFKNQGLKFAWLGKTISWLPFQETVTSIKQTSNGCLKSELDKGSKCPRSVLQRNDSLKKLITSKTQGIRRPFSETLKHRTVVTSACSPNGTAREEIIEEEYLTAVFVSADEYIYNPYAPNTRRKAICDEIERGILQKGATLRSLRRDLIVAVNLTNWHLL